MTIEVSIKFNQDFVRKEGDKFVVGIKSKPIAGKANQELIKKLSKYFGVPQGRIEIIRGKNSRRKTLKIS